MLEEWLQLDKEANLAENQPQNPEEKKQPTNNSGFSAESIPYMNITPGRRQVATEQSALPTLLCATLAGH